MTIKVEKILKVFRHWVEKPNVEKYYSAPLLLKHPKQRFGGVLVNRELLKMV